MSKKRELRNEIVKIKGVDSLLEIISNYKKELDDKFTSQVQLQQSEEIVKIGISVLSKYAADDLPGFTSTNPEGLTKILDLLASSPPEPVQFSCLYFFYNFVKTPTLENGADHKELTRMIGFIPRCVSFLQKPELTVLKLALEILFSLSSNDKCLDCILVTSFSYLLPLLEIEEFSIQSLVLSFLAKFSLLDCSFTFIPFRLLSLPLLTSPSPSLPSASAKNIIVSSGSLSRLFTLLESPIEFSMKESIATFVHALVVDGLLVSFSNFFL